MPALPDGAVRPSRKPRSEEQGRLRFWGDTDDGNLGNTVVEVIGNVGPDAQRRLVEIDVEFTVTGWSEGLIKVFAARWRRIGVVALLSLLLATLAAVAGLYWAVPLLTIEDRPVKADAEVILGGEPYYRPPRALEIFQKGFASNIVVSGHGDADEVRIWFKAKGVPASVIHVERNSRNTQQNARFTVPLLRTQHSKRVIIVTSWFHSRRALACFRKAAPEIEFISLPTVADRPRTRWPNRYERGMVLREYLKLAGYWVRYGVRPF